MSDPAGFIVIYDQVLRRKDLTATHKLVLGMLGRIQGKSASCYPSKAYIAKATGMSARQVQRVIQDLVTRKEVVRLYHHGEQSTYSVAWATNRNTRRRWAEDRQRGGLRSA